MTTTADPLAGVTRVLVDGSNLLFALRRASDPGTAGPPAALIGRLRGSIPPEIKIELVFDGPSERGLRGARIASGLTVRHSAPRSADDVLLAAAEEVRSRNGPAATDALLVVTDDRELRLRLRDQGARTIGAAWLIRRLEHRTIRGPSIANARPPGPRPAAPRPTGQRHRPSSRRAGR